ncbi:alpha/beta hydrolase [Roseibium sp.]|uniref:alpha/beta hydrolase n=1 Tax=Roseibium sp. TaxID=1936156 RepID=UPI003A971610
MDQDGMANMDAERILPQNGRTCNLVILLHGYGADATDLLPFAETLAKALPATAFVAPNAPDFLPYEALGGRQWFPLSDRDLREYRTGAEAAAQALTHFVDQELQQFSLRPEALAIFGFSQGAMMALQVGLRGKLAPAALAAFSGLLPGIDNLSDIHTGTPVLIVHGEDDDVVDPSHLIGARTALESIGVECEAHLLKELDHCIDSRGIELAADFLKRAFGMSEG